MTPEFVLIHDSEQLVGHDGPVVLLVTTAPGDRAGQTRRYPVDAEIEDIKRAWRRMVSRVHPDRGGGQSDIQRFNLAFEHLSQRSMTARKAEWEALQTRETGHSSEKKTQREDSWYHQLQFRDLYAVLRDMCTSWAISLKVFFLTSSVGIATYVSPAPVPTPSPPPEKHPWGSPARAGERLKPDTLGGRPQPPEVILKDPERLGRCYTFWCFIGPVLHAAGPVLHVFANSRLSPGRCYTLWAGDDISVRHPELSPSQPDLARLAGYPAVYFFDHRRTFYLPPLQSDHPAPIHHWAAMND